MSYTTRLKLPFIHSGQAQKEITHNEALNILDILTHPVVQAVKVESPPDNVQLGQLYIIGQNPQNEFINHASQIAQKLEQGWKFITAPKWLEVTLDSNGNKYRFDGNNWVESSALSSALPQQMQPSQSQVANNILINKDTGEYLKVEHLQEDVVLQGAYTNTRIQIPHHAIVIAVSVRVLQAISGTDSFSIGVEEDIAKYGGNLGAGQDTTNLGLTNHPLTYWQDTPIRLTATNGRFTAGKIKVTIQLLKPHGPWNWD